MFSIGVDNMKTFEDKKETLLTMAELYLDTRDNSYIFR